MKKYFLIALVLVAGIVSTSCSNDDDNTPEVVNEEEVITTVTLTLTPAGGGANIVLQSEDLDGEGPNAPIVTVSGNLQANTTYSGVVVFANETVSPPDNITLEVIEEAEEHQVFYITSGGLNLTASYSDTDSNGNPLGVAITLETGAASSGQLNVVLRHEPNKPNDGTLADAGGESDVDVSFSVTIE